MCVETLICAVERSRKRYKSVYVCQKWYEERANMMCIFSKRSHSVRKSNNQPTNDFKWTDQTVFYLWTHFIARSFAYTVCAAKQLGTYV